MKVDINCDMGESFGLYKMGQDEDMMPYITSANIACGYHAGDPHVMRHTVALAKKYGVGIGAHPGFPDLMGFGRRHLNCTPEEVKDYITYQMGALREFAASAGVTIEHCKPHGAMYMMAMEDEALARATLEAVAETNEEMIVFAFNNSAVAEIGKQMGIPIALEVYADREHTPDGSIVLTRKGEHIADLGAHVSRAVRMVKAGRVVAHTGEDVPIRADTICIHGDTPGAPALAKALVERLESEGIEVTPVRSLLV